MTANITTVSVTFENGIKREDYGPTKKASATITAAVSDKEDGEVILHQIGTLALAQVARLLDAPKPVQAQPRATSPEQAVADEAAARPRRGRPTRAAQPAETLSDTSGSATDVLPATQEQPVSTQSSTEQQSPAGEDWSASGPAEITDEVLLKTTSARAEALGDGSSVRIKALIASFSPKPAGEPFSVKELPQTQRQDYLTKLAALQ